MVEPFKFKQFTIQQDRCAMKVGTDGVLLGAATTLKNQPNSILDIGSGTGLIALMLAQRSEAETIDAIELDENAFEQCVENFEASEWSDRLFCYHAPFQAFYGEMDETYDLIVSNPPFFKERVTSGDNARDHARQNHALPFSELFKGVKNLLHSEGVFSMITPFDSEEHVLALAKTFGLFPFERLHVKGSPDVPVKRSIIQFGFNRTVVATQELTIETQRHRYTPAYIDLTKDFYLKM